MGELAAERLPAPLVIGGPPGALEIGSVTLAPSGDTPSSSSICSDLSISRELARRFNSKAYKRNRSERKAPGTGEVRLLL